MSEFAALSQAENPRHAVDAETAEWDEDATDNDREALELERMGAGTDERDVG